MAMRFSSSTGWHVVKQRQPALRGTQDPEHFSDPDNPQLGSPEARDIRIGAGMA
jgi:hypothetical protein